ncbi:MAG: L-ribulose-5-phosphate 4-epimerase [Calditrichaceae bacterium]|nr:L-ribulose-5-phosphate 4-epimerase [Calditrichaceae bacterium]RQV94187.1 MAG: L-ribulose-5-phosphate 4-epimerase [Calditrichota bacterium]
MVKSIKEETFKANLDLVKYGLVTLTWGNVSAIDRSEGLVVIKPSGVDYAQMKAEDMVVVDMQGRLVEGKLKPSSDLPTHLELYKNFPDIGGVAHTHSEFACMFAQACKEIPCYGTTHADHFNGPVPLTRFLKEDEVNTGYELNTGVVIIERFMNLNALETPGVLVAGHGPFTWGKSAADAVNNSLVLEKIAKMAWGVRQLNDEAKPLPDYILKKHYERKHGKHAYYGQKNRG